MKDAKITINGVAAPGFRLVIEGVGVGLTSWRVVGELTPQTLAYAHSFALGSKYLIHVSWSEGSRSQERIGWAMFASVDVGNELGDEFATFVGNGALYAPIGQAQRFEREQLRDYDALVDELARARERIAALVDQIEANVMPAPHIHDVRTALAVAMIRASGYAEYSLALITTWAREVADELTREDSETCPTIEPTLSGGASGQQSSDSREPATDADTGALPT